MRGSIARIIAFATLAGFAAGCGPTFDFQGNWSGQRRLDAPPGVDPSVVRAVAKVRLQIQGSRFDLLEAGTTKSGSVRYEAGRAFLRVDSYLGRPIEALGSGAARMNKEIELRPVSKDRLLFVDPAGFDPKPIELARDSQP
ncbi:MAG: hypothetical protein N2109_06010 [Fimbriimonadales bacterium]|nr:hypothetical protein [Fimbriimonadales bacterium]